jgi:MoxR-like ATPase
MKQSSSIGFNRLKPSYIAEMIETIAATKISLYVHGSPGISKSAVARQVADKQGMAFIDVRLSQMAPEDVRGVPFIGEIDHVKGLIWTPPLIFPRDLALSGIQTISYTEVIRFFNPLGNNSIHYCTAPKFTVTAVTPGQTALIAASSLNDFTVRLVDATGEAAVGSVLWQVHGAARAMLALEEFNAAPPSVMAASYQLILDRRIGDYVVPDGVMIIAMGNRDSDKGVTHVIPKPVANRFIHVEMEFDYDDFFNWGSANAMAPEVLGFLSNFPTKANDFQPDNPTLSFATPRTWEFVSRLLQSSTPRSPAVLRAAICGAVGDAIGNEFLQHRRFMADMPAIDGIFDGSLTQFTPSNPSHETQIAYSVCIQLCAEMKRRADLIAQHYSGPPSRFDQYPPREAWFEQCDRAFGYIADNFRPDISLMAIRLALKTHQLAVFSPKMPRLYKFIKQHTSLILDKDHA